VTARLEDNTTRLLVSHRRALYAYIRAIVCNHATAEDVFQEVSVVVVRRWQEAGGHGDFWKLAREVARRQCLAALRRSKNAPLLLSSEALDALDVGFEALAESSDERAQALERCLEELPDRWREIIRFRYFDKLAVTEIAARLSTSANTISVTLHRIREKLADCVAASLGAERPS
jgi:RNA polymerase sigma-70 factor (ECF subfamily)